MTPDRLSDATVALTAELVAIDSVNPGLDPGAAGEREAAETVATRLGRAGFRVQLVGDRERPSVVAVRDGSRAGRSVVLNGHLDTVPVHGMTAPFDVAEERARLAGRGTSDMKGGVAAVVVAAEELAARDAPGRLSVVLVADEEDGSIGATAVLKDRESLIGAPDVCLIAEPTWLDDALAHRGYELVRVRLTGRASHSSQPEEGADVVPAVAGLLAAVIRADADLGRQEPDPMLGRGSLMTTVVRAGSAPFTVAAAAEVLVERRTLPGEAADAGLSEVRSLVDGLGLPAGVSASVESVIRRSAWRRAWSGPSAELTESIGRALANRGAQTSARGFPYWMESALWEEAGVPTVVRGPAGGGLHAVDEWVDIVQLRAFAPALVEAVGAFLAGPPRVGVGEGDPHHIG